MEKVQKGEILMSGSSETTRESRKYWKNYLMLEKRFIESLEYVELCENNFNAFSDNYARLLIIIGSELDVIFKNFYYLDPPNRDNAKPRIIEYGKYVLGKVPYIVSFVITSTEYDIKIQPFKKWDPDKSKDTLKWWDAFNNMKHHRYDKIDEATQKNVLDMLGALYIVEQIYLKEAGGGASELIYSNPSKLFNPRFEISEGGRVLEELKERIIEKLKNNITNVVDEIIRKDPELKNLYDNAATENQENILKQALYEAIKIALNLKDRSISNEPSESD